MTTPHPDDATVRASAERTPRAAGDRAQFSPGTLIAGRYRIVSLLGSGGMGEVYRADDIKLGQTVALKFLPAALARDPILLGRLHDEVRLGRQVSHPNVCRIYDIGEFGHAHFVAMEYVDGEDLAHLLRRIGRLAHDKGIELAHGIAAGLAAAHSKGILHRDLKPANVMIDSHGNPRITDFGLALDFDDSGFADAAGTPAYMAPEQLDGKPASVQSDLYALGLVMYEMFTGCRPYGGKSMAELRDAISSSDTQPPSSHARDLEPVVEQIILRCLSRDPALRPRSAREVLETLPGGDPLAAAMAAGQTPSPRMVAAAGAEGSLRRRAAWSWLGGITAMLAILIGVNAEWHGRNKISFDTPPAILEQRAVDIATTLGLPRPNHRVPAMFVNSRYLSWVEESDRSPLRFADLRRGPPAVLFAVRLSREPLTPLGDRARANGDDPPMTHPGDANVVIDNGGRLFSLTAVPPGPAKGKADWNRLLGLAGFDINALRRSEPRELPPHFSDERAAWDGVWPDAPSRQVHIEAAAAGGVPVWFRLTGPWDTWSESRQAFSGRTFGIVFGSVAGASVLLCLFLAWRNFRLRRGDRAGAWRLAVTLMIISAMSALLYADYSGGLRHQTSLVFTIIRDGLMLGAFFSIAYIALEPFIRRRWPERLIGWTRLLGGRLRDPMVGRDVLIGVAAGIAHAHLAGLDDWLPGRMGWELPSAPILGGYSSLLSLRHTFSGVFYNAIGALLFGLIPIILLVGLTILLRRRAFAVVGLFLVISGVYTVGARGNLYMIAVSLVIALIWTAVAVRVGLLGIVVAQYSFFLAFGASGIDLSSWAAASLLVPLVLLVALTLYAFRTSLGGQPAFSGSLIDD
jgi:hypothetical protein